MRRYAIALSTFILIAGAAAPAEEPQPAKKEESSAAEYSRLDENVAILAGKTAWYLEELDADGRPSEGTYWKDGKITKRVSWSYYEGSERAKAKVETDDVSSTETLYDERGNVVSVVVSDAEGKTISSERYEYTADNLISVSKKEAKGLSTVVEYFYAGGKTVSSTRTSVNGKLVSACAYASEFDWTETVYNEMGKAILVVEYKDGVRQVRR